MPIAKTVSDADGRFVLCGQDGDNEVFVFAGKPGYQLAEVGMVSTNGQPIQIELKR